MTQWDFDTICQIIHFGAPALEHHLITALRELVSEYQKVTGIEKSTQSETTGSDSAG